MKPTPLPSSTALDTDLLLLDMQVGASLDDIIDVPKAVLSWPKYLMSRHKKLLRGLVRKKIRAKL